MVHINLEKTFFTLMMAAITIGMTLVVLKSFGDAAGAGSAAENWTTQVGTQYTSNASVFGLLIVIVLISAAIGYMSFLRKR